MEISPVNNIGSGAGLELDANKPLAILIRQWFVGVHFEQGVVRVIEQNLKQLIQLSFRLLPQAA